MSESRTPRISGSSSSSSWQSVSVISDTPFRCLHFRLLHAKCGHVSFLECHEVPCPIPHVGWIAEKIPPEPPSPCYEMKHYVRMKDENCKACQSYVESTLSKTVTAVRGWFGYKEVVEKETNPVAMPQEAIDAIVLGWYLQIEHTRDQKMQFEEEQRERKKLCVESAVVGHKELSSGNAEETVAYRESDKQAVRPARSQDLPEAQTEGSTFASGFTFHRNDAIWPPADENAILGAEGDEMGEGSRQLRIEDEEEDLYSAD